MPERGGERGVVGMGKVVGWGRGGKGEEITSPKKERCV